MQNKQNNFIQSVYSPSLKSSDVQSLAWAIALATIFFSPYLFQLNPQFNFFGDVSILYFPQFVEGYHLAKEGILAGIDFLTSNGSTAYFLRPNIPVYYPPYQLIYALNFESVGSLARAFVFIAYAHSVVAAYYCMKIGRKYFQMDYGTSLLFAVLYSYAIADSALTAPPFYYVAALFPLLLYFAFQSVGMKSYRLVPLYSIPYILVFLSGYLPLDVNAVLITVLFTMVYFWQSKGSLTESLGLNLRKLLSPIALASIIVLPLYLAMFYYHKHVPGLPEGVWSSAHQFSFGAGDIFALLSRAFPASNPGTGAPFVKLGLAPVTLIILAFTQRNKLGLTVVDAKIIALALSVFFFYMLLAFGQSSGLPDLFYFVVPVIGKMHLYGRYLLIASFFFFLAVALSFKYLIQIREALPLGYWLFGFSILMLVAVSSNKFVNQDWINLNQLAVEILMVCFMLISLLAHQRFYAFVGVIGVPFFMYAASFNSYTNSISVATPPPYKNDVAFTSERREALNNYFRSNSEKYLIKYIDITSGIEKPNGLMLNYPWFVDDKIKLSNYMGYEPHMAVDKDYMAAFPHPYYGKINVQWLLRTGADFVIYNQASWDIYSKELGPLIDQNVPKFDLGFGYNAAKFKSSTELAEHLSDGKRGDFDNGIVAISANIGKASVTDFKTDLATYVLFHVESASPVTIRYNLFPSKMMALYVNGVPFDSTLKDGLLELTLPSGAHQVEYVYKSRLHHVFIYCYLGYLIIVVGMLGWRAWVGFGFPFFERQKKIWIK